MKSKTQGVIGIVSTILIFFTAIFISRNYTFSSEIIPSSFLTTSSELLLSGILIYILKKKGLLNFRLKAIRLNYCFRIIRYSIVAFVLVNVLTLISFTIIGVPFQEEKNPFLEYSPFQYFFFVFIFASVAEEFLFRGYLLNMLNGFANSCITVFNKQISLSAILSGLLFGSAHLILLTSNNSLPFVLKVVFMTSTIGILAGYLQEKNQYNTFVAIIVHMTVNGLGLLGLLITSAMAT